MKPERAPRDDYMKREAELLTKMFRACEEKYNSLPTCRLCGQKQIKMNDDRRLIRYPVEFDCYNVDCLGSILHRPGSGG